MVAATNRMSHVRLLLQTIAQAILNENPDISIAGSQNNNDGAHSRNDKLEGPSL